MKTYVASIPPYLVDADIHAHMSNIGEGCELTEVMAASLKFVFPLDVCLLRFLLDYAAARSESVIFDCPSDPDVHRYLCRMDFYRDLPGNVQLSSAVPNLVRKNLGGSLIEMTRVTKSIDVEDVIHRTWEVTRAQFGSGNMATATATAVGAATENVLDHAESQFGALVAAQRYKKGLQLAVADLGLGIPTTMRRLPKYSKLSDQDAVALSLKDQETSTGRVGQGAGLYELLTAIGRAGNSNLVIRSGLAHLTIQFQGGLEIRRFLTPPSSIQGTLISIHLLPNKSKNQGEKNG